MADPTHFVVVGGGTAGWIAAFILQDSARRRKLDARISVVESSKMPTVGVGEATTAAFRVFLKQFGIDEFEFFRKTEPQSPLAYTLEEAIRRGRMSWPDLLAELVSDAKVRDSILVQLGIRPPTEAPPAQ